MQTVEPQFPAGHILQLSTGTINNLRNSVIAIARILVRLLEDFSRDRKENVIYRVHVSPTEHAQC